MTRVRVLVVTGLLGMCGSAAAGEEGLFPFVVSYDTPANATNVAAWLDRPAGVHGFIRAEDGHLRNDAGPVRFWATNIAFEGCFPTHQQAERLAARLARLGINCVRMHHMDSYSIWGNSPNKLTIDPREAGAPRLFHRPAQEARSLHEPEPPRLALVRRGGGVFRTFAAARVRQGARQLRAANDRAPEEIRPRPPDACQPVHRQSLYPGARDCFRRDQQRERPARDLGLGPDRSASRALFKHVSEALERLAQAEVWQHGATPQGLERGGGSRRSRVAAQRQFRIGPRKPLEPGARRRRAGRLVDPGGRSGRPPLPADRGEPARDCRVASPVQPGRVPPPEGLCRTR